MKSETVKAPAAKRADKARKKIFILDDHPVTRHGLTKLLNQEPDLVVCGEAENATDALATIKALQPDLAIVDLTLPGKSGLEFMKDVRSQLPDLLVLVVSMHDESTYAERILRAGGRGYLMKSEGGAKVLKAVRQVLQGNVYLSERMSAQILNIFAGQRPRSNDSPLAKLTDREFEVFQLMGQGLSTHEISARLYVSSKTVDTHRLHIKEKLQLKSLPELIKYAIRWGASEELG